MYVAGMHCFVSVCIQFYIAVVYTTHYNGKQLLVLACASASIVAWQTAFLSCPFPSAVSLCVSEVEG